MQIRSLNIRRYRGLTEFDWLPSSGVNCLIGPGDSGKSSVLAAVSLLLAPYPIAAASEFDYLDRNVPDGFEIQACLAVDDDVLASERTTPPIWGWRDGHRVELPEEGTEPVIVVRVRGTAELEVVHEIIPPAGDPVLLTVGFRKKLLLARLVGEDRASRDLRVTQGSLLDRLLGRADLRGVLAGAISTASAQLRLPQEVSENVQRLAGLLDEAGLPHDLHLGLAAIPGLPLPGLLTLLQGQDPAAAIPLAGVLMDLVQEISIALDAGKRATINNGLQRDRIIHRSRVGPLLKCLERLYERPTPAGFCAAAGAILDGPPEWLSIRLPGVLRVLSRVRPHDDNPFEALDATIAIGKLRPFRPTLMASTVHKSKGMEFDHVCICPFSASHFPNNDFARRLIYVALSRARRTIEIIVPGLGPSPLLGP